MPRARPANDLQLAGHAIFARRRISGVRPRRACASPLLRLGLPTHHRQTFPEPAPVAQCEPPTPSSLRCPARATEGTEESGPPPPPENRCCCSGCSDDCCCGRPRARCSDCCSTSRRAPPGADSQAAWPGISMPGAHKCTSIIPQGTPSMRFRRSGKKFRRLAQSASRQDSETRGQS